MKIEIWSDIACPYCYLGKRRFELALAELSFDSEIEVIWRSFELDPTAEISYDKSKYELLAEKYDQSEKWAELLCESLTLQGKELNIEFDFDNNKVGNTFNAHRLLHFARKHNKESDLMEILFKRFFTDGWLISSTDNLLKCAEDVGLNLMDCQSILEGEDLSSSVKEDEQMATEIGIQSVPFFIIDEAYGMEGAQPVEHIKKMIMDIKSGNLS